jgi:hypothetical protein
MTKQQSTAVRILNELWDADLPPVLTAREAVDVCSKYGVDAPRWAQQAKTGRGEVNLSQVAKFISTRVKEKA